MGATESKSDDELMLEKYLAEYDDQKTSSTSSITSWCDVERGLTWADVVGPGWLDKVPARWLGNLPPSHCYSLFLALFYSIFCLGGLFGNGMCLWIFFRNKSLRTPSNMLLANLAASDLFMCMTSISFIINAWNCGPNWSYIGCQIYGFVGAVTGVGSIMTITMMSMDRYQVISNPLKPRWLTKWRAILLILFIWLYALAFSLPPLLEYASSFVPEADLLSCSFDYSSQELSSQIFFGVFFCFAYCVPLVAIVWSYSGIIGSVMGSEKAFNKFEEKAKGPDVPISTVSGSTKKPTSAEQKGNHQQEIKIAKVSLALVSLWFLAWTPYAAIALTAAYLPWIQFAPIIAQLPAMFAKTSATINPFVYTLSHPGFRRCLNQMLSDKNKKKKKLQKSVEDNATIGSDID